MTGIIWGPHLKPRDTAHINSHPTHLKYFKDKTGLVYT